MHCLTRLLHTVCNSASTPVALDGALVGWGPLMKDRSCTNRSGLLRLAALLCLICLEPLAASGGGGGGGGGSRSGGGGGGYRGGGGGGGRATVDVVYQLGQQVYNGRVKLSPFKPAQFDAQIKGLEQAASWASSSNNQRAPNFYALAGHLSQKQYNGLQRFLKQRHKVDIPAAKADSDYAFAVRWLLQPGTGYATEKPQLKAKKATTKKQHRFN